MVQPQEASRREFAQQPGVRWNAMIHICALSKIDELTPAQRAAHLAFWYMSEAYNGGHFQYFVNQRDLDHQAVIRALDSIGATEQSRVLASAVIAASRHPVGIPQSVEEYLADEDAADLRQFDEDFSKCSRTIEDCLAQYLDQHEGEFVAWVP